MDTANILQLSDINDYLNTVEMGRLTHRRINHLWDKPGQIVCDFRDVHGMTGAFADEAFGKMFLEKGSRHYVRKVRFQNLNQLVETILKSTLYRRYEELKSDDRPDWK